jgi:hypothetical protein
MVNHVQQSFGSLARGRTPAVITANDVRRKKWTMMKMREGRSYNSWVMMVGVQRSPSGSVVVWLGSSNMGLMQ